MPLRAPNFSLPSVSALKELLIKLLVKGSAFDSGLELVTCLLEILVYYEVLALHKKRRLENMGYLSLWTHWVT